MRRLALAALLALAASACSVKTEGAACADTANCPDGQACGYDRKCSKEAAGCPTAICRQDSCSANTPQRCDVAANGICASLTPLATCGAGACAELQGKAACVSLALTAPTDGTLVDPAHPSAAVTAELTVDRADFPLPATLALQADGADTGIALQPSAAGSTTYIGSYAPLGAVEGDVALRAALGALVSASRTVDVDTRPPTFAATAASCATAPCVRDGAVNVTATATDRHAIAATANLSLGNYDGARAVALVPTATPDEYGGSLSLGLFPFPGFSAQVAARITAVDARGNSATADVVVAGGDVTRLRRSYAPTSNPITSPAILSNGNAVVGIAVPGTSATDQLRAMTPGGTEIWKQTLQVAPSSGYPLAAAPACGASNVFAASTDGRIYLVNPDGSLPSGTFHMPTAANLGQAVEGLQPPWLRTVSSVDHAFTAIATNNNTTAPRLYQLWSDGSTAAAASGEVAAASGIWIGAKTAVVTGTAGATLRRYLDDGLATADGALALADGAAAPTACDRVSVPLASDAPGFAVIACDNGQLHRVEATAATLAAGYLGNLGAAPTGSPVVLAGGDYLVPLANGTIARVTGQATPPALFSTLPAGDVARGLAVAAANPSTGAPATVYASAFNAVAGTSAVRALDLASGALLWSAPLGTSALDFPTIAPATAAPGALPTLLVGSGEGKLFRVVVDAPLDDSAPWPKAHHDVRNTGNPVTPVNGP